ncbi:MAG: SBBP repeat-containing protein [Candidatus Sulfotelmatobacter sp.]
MSKSSASTMWKPIVWIVAALSVAVLAFAGVTHLRHQRATVSQLPANAPAARAAQSSRVRSNFGALPLAFEANQGQTDPRVKYMARGSGYTVFLTPNDTVFALHSSTPASPSAAHATNFAERSRARLAQKQINASISMKLAGGNPQPAIAAQNELPGHSNYFIGRDPSQWQTGVKQYSRVSYRDVYPGVDMAFHGQQRQLEFDFIISPGASPAPIAFDVSGARKISTDADGNLVLASQAGNVLLHKPVAYQEKNNTREPVDAGFVVQANNKIGFTLGNYDRSRELVIDPSVTYATFLGGTADDEAYAIAIDSSGNAYVTGETSSTNFPTTSGAPYKSYQLNIDAFVSKISADGSTLEYSTYVGGTGSDSGNAIAVDGSGNAYVAGATNSGSGSNFPITPGAFQASPQGGYDAFVLELNSTGSALTFCTYLGGGGDDFAHGIAVDTSGVYVVGSTASTNFPDTTSGFQTAISGTSNGFVTKLNTSGTAPLIYSSYLGGGSNDVANAVAVDSSNQAYVTGATLNANGNFPTKNPLQPQCGGTASGCSGLYDAFVTVVDKAGSGLVYSTFLGGTGNDQGLGIAVDGSGDAYVTGLTQSTNFPVKNALYGTFAGTTQDAFVAEINSTGSALVYSTYLGGSVSQTGTGIAVDSSKNAYVTGQTNSTDFPTASPTQKNIGGGKDAFVTQIAPGGASLVFSTFLGGPQDENVPTAGTATGAIAVDSAGANIYVAGDTASSTFPVTGSAVQGTYGGNEDAFVAKYATGGTSGGSFTIANGALSNPSGSPGVLANATITVNSSGGFTSAVTLACAVSPVVTNGPTCGFTGSPVTPPANGSGTATLNVATTAASARLTPPANGRSGMLYAMILPVFGLSLVGAGFGPSGSRRRKLFGFILLGMVLTGLLILPACSSSSSSGGGGGGTPANTYTITVTGSGGGATATGTPALTLTVN